jgi:hypothetical protein
MEHVEPDLRPERDVRKLAGEIGERNDRDAARHRKLEDAADYIEGRLRALGLPPRAQAFFVDGRRYRNLEVVLGPDDGSPALVVGAHYDSVRGSPGANDNATGVAAALALADTLNRTAPTRTVRVAFFTNEEPPHTRKATMGSLVYAKALARRSVVVHGMISLETVGFFTQDRHHETLPAVARLGPLGSPMRPDFFAVVGNLRSRAWGREVGGALSSAGARVRTAALPGILPGVRSSDHWSFWQTKTPAVMITDTAPLRYRHYHRPSDALEQVAWPAFRLAVSRIVRALAAVAGAHPSADAAG